jgi:hypothetical protein
MVVWISTGILLGGVLGSKSVFKVVFWEEFSGQESAFN